MIIKILNFNVDFRFLQTVTSLPQIIEVNSDYLSRYTIAQNVGYSPRKKRFTHVNKNASVEGANLSVLYHPVLLSDQKKAMRWGIDTTDELKQDGFFPANFFGLSALNKKLSRSEPHWVLLLGTSPGDIERVKQDNPGTLFIGHDSIFDRVCNDKFLATQVIPAHYQPASTLLRNGASAEVLIRKVREHVQSSDIILKPLQEHSGIGVCRVQNDEGMLHLFSMMHQAKAHAELLKLKMNYQFENPEHYWVMTGANNPYVLAQAYAPTDTQGNVETTYRAVFTAYITHSHQISLEIDCIYPKKSNPGNFRSNTGNEIYAEEVEALVKNEKLKSALIEGVEPFVKTVSIATSETLDEFYETHHNNHSTEKENVFHINNFSLSTEKALQTAERVARTIENQDDRTIIKSILTLAAIPGSEVRKLVYARSTFLPSDYLNTLSQTLDARYRQFNSSFFRDDQKIAAFYSCWRKNEADTSMQWAYRCQGIRLLTELHLNPKNSNQVFLKFVYHYLLENKEKYDFYHSLTTMKFIFSFQNEKYDEKLIDNLKYLIDTCANRFEFLDQSTEGLKNLVIEAKEILNKQKSKDILSSSAQRTPSLT